MAGVFNHKPRATILRFLKQPEIKILVETYRPLINL